MTSTERVPQHREIQKDIWLSVLVAFAIGIGLGALLSENALLANEATRLETLAWIGLLGHLFLSVIKFIVAPLIFSSICLAIAAPSELPDPGKLTLKVFAVFVFTTLAATIVGLSLAHLFQPGHAIDSSLVESTASFEAGDAITALSSEIGWLPQAFIGLVPSDLTAVPTGICSRF